MHRLGATEGRIEELFDNILVGLSLYLRIERIDNAEIR